MQLKLRCEIYESIPTYSFTISKLELRCVSSTFALTHTIYTSFRRLQIRLKGFHNGMSNHNSSVEALHKNLGNYINTYLCFLHIPIANFNILLLRRRNGSNFQTKSRLTIKANTIDNKSES